MSSGTSARSRRGTGISVSRARATKALKEFIRSQFSGDPIHAKTLFWEAGKNFAGAHKAGKALVLDFAWVRPDVRRTGIGAALLRARLAWGRSKGCTTAQTYTAYDNIASINNLIKAGFRVVERPKWAKNLNGDCWVWWEAPL